MSQIDSAWGAVPSAEYEDLAQRFRPLFARIREGAVDRELERRLPIQELNGSRKQVSPRFAYPRHTAARAPACPSCSTC